MPPIDRGQTRLTGIYPGGLFKKAARSQDWNAGPRDLRKLPYRIWHPWAARYGLRNRLRMAVGLGPACLMQAQQLHMPHQKPTYLQGR